MLRMFGASRAPPLSMFTPRSHASANQQAWLTEKRISPQVFSAAEDLCAVEGNICCTKSLNGQELTYYVNSSHNLVQDSKQNVVTSRRIKLYSAINVPTGSTLADVQRQYTSLHKVQRYTSSNGFVFICECRSFQVGLPIHICEVLFSYNFHL